MLLIWLFLFVYFAVWLFTLFLCLPSNGTLYLNHTSCSGKFCCLMAKLLREVLGPLPSFFCLEVKWIIRVNYRFNDLLFISKENTERIFFWMQGEQIAGSVLAWNAIAAFSACPVYRGFIFLASVWGPLCRHTSPLVFCCLTFGFWLLVNFEGMVSWYEVFCSRVVKGISDHFIVHIKVIYCKRNLTSLWQSERNRVGMAVFEDIEWFSVMELGLDIAENLTTAASYQVKSPFSCICLILSSVTSNSSYHGKNTGLGQSMQWEILLQNRGTSTYHDTSTTGQTQLLCATCSTVSPRSS